MVLGIGGGGKKKKEEEEAAAASAREAELAAVAEAATRSKPDTLRLFWWVVLTLVSLVVMGSAAEVEDQLSSCDGECAWGITSGVVSFLVAAFVALWIGLTGCCDCLPTASLLVEGICAVFLAVWWVPGVAVNTGDNGLGSFGANPRPNVYYGSWIALFVSLDLVFLSWDDLMDFLCKPRVQKAAIERAKSNVAETSTAAEEAAPAEAEAKV